ncbi:MAG TPA: GYF domain-containing protein [Fimbriimonas sp.]|nr:GYF domain-containing protein [Fimbriimonas sp.]
MQYWVIATDGQKYGPADVATLNTWVAQGRVTATTMVQELASGDQMLASQIPGILLVPYSGTQNYNNNYQNVYPRVMDPMGGKDGAKEVQTAWGLGVAGLLCCGIFAIFGVIKASNAQRAGFPNAQGALIFNVIVLIIGFGLVPALSGIFR